jgi:hypothetical protein
MYIVGCLAASAFAGSVLAEAQDDVPRAGAAAPAASRLPASLADEAARRAKIEAAITDTLIDPESAKFKWADVSSVHLTKFKPSVFTKTFAGDILLECGRVNSRNKMGGYSGFHWFVVGFQDGITFFGPLLDDDGEYTNDIAGGVCRKQGL